MYLIPFILFSFLLLYVHPYNRKAAVHYASTFWNSANHDCNTTYPALPIATSGKSTATTEKIMVETAPTLLVSVSLQGVTLH